MWVPRDIIGVVISLFVCSVILVPSGAPQNLAIINSNSTSVFISWDSVECIHRNGLIIHYLLVYEPVDACGNSLATITTVDSDESDDGGSYLATGLDPSSSYLFKVAAVNNIGIGPFATVQTKKGCLLCTHLSCTNMWCFVRLGL